MATARNIVRFMKKANASFSVYDTKATGVCEFYRQLTASKTRKENPKCVIKYTPILHGNPAELNFEFVNGRTECLKVESMNVKSIFEELETICNEIETEYEDQGKNIDQILNN